MQLFDFASAKDIVSHQKPVTKTRFATRGFAPFGHNKLKTSPTCYVCTLQRASLDRDAPPSHPDLIEERRGFGPRAVQEAAASSRPTSRIQRPRWVGIPLAALGDQTVDFFVFVRVGEFWWVLVAIGPGPNPRE